MKLLLTSILTLFSYCIFAQGVSNAGTAPGTHASESEEGSVSGTLGQSMSGTGESEEGDVTQGMEQPSEVEMFFCSQDPWKKEFSSKLSSNNVCSRAFEISSTNLVKLTV